MGFDSRARALTKEHVFVSGVWVVIVEHGLLIVIKGFDSEAMGV